VVKEKHQVVTQLQEMVSWRKVKRHVTHELLHRNWSSLVVKQNIRL